MKRMKEYTNIQKKNINEKHLKLLGKQFPTIDSAATEIINLEAILNLPKGTEHFLTDIHGEYEPFIHVLKNGSGVVKVKIEEVFRNTLLDSEKKSLATLVYYPEQKIDQVIKKHEKMEDWYRVNLYRLIELCRNASSKYTRSKVRKALPPDFRYIIEELLHEQENGVDKHEYYDRIINTIIEVGQAKEFIIALSQLIQRLVIDRLHIIGDIYDRGPRPDIIMETLLNYHSVDIQWGNHDIVWMGAAAGQQACIANVLRVSARYNNLDVIEDAYGINLLPLATFALSTYQDDPCTSFQVKDNRKANYCIGEIDLTSKMHKAITIIQLKLEYQVIMRHKEFEMENRLLLHRIDYKNGTIEIEGKVYQLNDTNFPTINPDAPYELTEEEQNVIERLTVSFINSEKLQKHIRFLFKRGSIYLRYNSNLLFHGCIPMNGDQTFQEMRLKDQVFTGKALLDQFEELARVGYFNESNEMEKQYGMDIMWYLWCGAKSSLFGKEAMKMFERYFLEDEEMMIEKKNAYYRFRDDESMCNQIFQEFGLDPNESRIINGHVPVKKKDGESPIKANGKLLVIDGGFSRAYQSKTGIAGYTLIYNSYGLQIVAHEPFESMEKAITMELDILSTRVVVEKKLNRKRVKDTDIGLELMDQIEDLKVLLKSYRQGALRT